MSIAAKNTATSAYSIELEAISGSEDLMMPLPEKVIERLNLQDGDDVCYEFRDGVMRLFRIPAHSGV